MKQLSTSFSMTATVTVILACATGVTLSASEVALNSKQQYPVSLVSQVSNVEKSNDSKTEPPKNTAPEPNYLNLPTCTEAQEKYHELAGKLPEEYPAARFDKEQLIKAIVEIANNPDINIQELSALFGLRFIACSLPVYIKGNKVPKPHVVYISDAGFPLRKSNKTRGMGAYYSYFVDTRSDTLDYNTRSIGLYFDFDSVNAKHETSLHRFNCVEEKNLTKYFKEDWKLSENYGHVSYKTYRRIINGHEVAFSAKPYVNPYYKPPLSPFPPRPLCLEYIDVSFKPVK